MPPSPRWKAWPLRSTIRSRRTRPPTRRPPSNDAFGVWPAPVGAASVSFVQRFDLTLQVVLVVGHDPLEHLHAFFQLIESLLPSDSVRVVRTAQTLRVLVMHPQSQEPVGKDDDQDRNYKLKNRIHRRRPPRPRHTGR